MTVFSLLAVGLVMKIVSVLFILSAVALVLVILIQKGRGGGLSAAFGGGGAGGLLGSKTGDVLTWVTIGFVAAFLFLAVIMAKFYKPDISDISTPGMVSGQSDTPTPDQPQTETTAPAETPATDTPATDAPVSPTPDVPEDTAPAPNTATP